MVKGKRIKRLWERKGKGVLGRNAEMVDTVRRYRGLASVERGWGQLHNLEPH